MHIPPHRDAGGSLAVDLRVLDVDGNDVFLTTRTNAADTIDDIVGGPRYEWFTSPRAYSRSTSTN